MANAMRALWRKECHFLCAPLPVLAVIFAWFAWGIYFLAALREYQALAARFASLSPARGASEMLLLPVNRLLLLLLALWIVFFAARSIGEEYACGTVALYRRRFVSWLLAKSGALLLFGALFTLPFWFSVAWLSSATRFDRAVLVGVAAAQALILVYCCAMACCVALWLRRQALAAALLGTLLLLLLWLLPSLVSSPAGLVAMLEWLSPFAHARLLVGGQFTLQSVLFVVLQSGLFLSFIAYFHLGER